MLAPRSNTGGSRGANNEPSRSSSQGFDAASGTAQVEIMVQVGDLGLSDGGASSAKSPHLCSYET
jgi:hypothetical protein